METFLIKDGKSAEDIVVEYLRLKEQNKTSYIFKIFKRLLETAFSNDPKWKKKIIYHTLLQNLILFTNLR